MRSISSGAAMRLIDALYDAAQEPQGWPAALKMASENFGAAGATVLVIDRPTNELRLFEGYNIPDEAFVEYRDHYLAVDPRLRFVRQHPEHALYYDRLHHSEAEIDRDEYYEWLRRVGGFRYYAAGRTINTLETAGFFTVQRTARQGHLDREELDMLQRLQPHIVRSSQISLLLASSAVQLEAARETLHEIATGVLLLDRRGRIIFRNRTAEALLQRSALLRCEGETTLGAPRLGHHQRLQRAIADALQGLDEARGRGAELLLSDDDGAAMMVRIMPLFGRERPVLGSDAAVAVFLHDPAQRAADCAGELGRRFNLTHAEAQLCQALLEGRTLKEHAAQTGTNHETARTHLKRILIKTGTRRQAELVAYLMRRLPPLR